jgi:hypothetical protein
MAIICNIRSMNGKASDQSYLNICENTKESELLYKKLALADNIQHIVLLKPKSF